MSTGSIWTGAFWKAAAERAISTFAQAFIGAGLVINLTDLDATGNSLLAAGSIGLTSAILSVIKSVGFGLASSEGSPSLVEVPKAKVEEKIEAALEDENARQARLAQGDNNGEQ